MLRYRDVVETAEERIGKDKSETDFLDLGPYLHCYDEYVGARSQLIKHHYT